MGPKINKRVGAKLGHVDHVGSTYIFLGKNSRDYMFIRQVRVGWNIQLILDICAAMVTKKFNKRAAKKPKKFLNKHVGSMPKNQ